MGEEKVEVNTLCQLFSLANDPLPLSLVKCGDKSAYGYHCPGRGALIHFPAPIWAESSLLSVGKVWRGILPSPLLPLLAPCEKVLNGWCDDMLAVIPFFLLSFLSSACRWFCHVSGVSATSWTLPFSLPFSFLLASSLGSSVFNCFCSWTDHL